MPGGLNLRLGPMNKIRTQSWENSDWELLKQLRSVFLSETFSESRDYWTSPHLLQLYHQTFAQRIGWKWDAVLYEVVARVVAENEKSFNVMDYGCGTGIASQKIIEHFGSRSISSVWLWDKSPNAINFCEKQLKEVAPELSIRKLDFPEVPDGNWILCLSHIVNELTDRELQNVLELARKATYVFWVEPGTSGTSRKLIEVREKLRVEMNVIAPCTHQERCGMLTGENASHWCHHFALPPNQVYQSAFWHEFSRRLGIDLRSLPTSYLVLSTNKLNSSASESACRVIGRPRLYKGNGKFLVCDEKGVEEMRLLERENKALFKDYKSDIFFKLLPKTVT